MNDVQKIVKSIPIWSKQFQSNHPSWDARYGIVKAHNFVTDLTGDNWTYGRSVGANGEFHRDGAGARYRLEELGFVDVLNSRNLPRKLKCDVEDSFRAWAQKVTLIDLCAKLDRYKNGKLGYTFRLMVPPNFIITWRKSAAKIRRKSKNNRGKRIIQTLMKNDGNFSKFQEGFRNEIIHEIALRDRRLIKLARNTYKAICAVCGFDFGKRYGKHGQGFIEFHHLIPLNQGKRSSTIKDIKPVCANCHRMLHRDQKIVSISKLKSILIKSGNKYK